MNREYLESLGLETDVINQIMKEHGKTVNPLKDSVSSLEKEKTQLEERVTKHEDQLDELKKGDDTDLSKQITDLQSENKTLKETHETELAEQKRNHAIQLAVKDLGTADDVYISEKLSGLELKDGELVGFDEKVEELKEKHPALFDSAEPVKPKKWSQGNSTTNSGALTREDIMKETDPNKRQELIRENRELFTKRG